MGPVDGRGSRQHELNVQVLLVRADVSYDKQTVLVSRDIQEDLVANGQHYLALATQTKASWTLFKTAPASTNEREWNTLWLPPDLYTRYCSRTVFARPCSPIQLQSVIIVFPESTYTLVSQSKQAFRALLEQGTVLCTGESVEVHGYRGVIRMCEPVRQGVLSATTDIVVAREPPSADSWNPHAHEDAAEVDASDSDDDEVNEAAFASLLHSGFLSKQTTHLTYALPGTDTQLSPTLDLPAVPLHRNLSLDRSAPQARGDPEYCAYAPLALLLKLGSFSGESVVLATAETSRTLQLLALPVDYGITEVEAVYLPPVLLYNLCGQQRRLKVTKATNQKERPVATSVTLARVPSPASTDRILQSAFLSALKYHFEQHRRTVRQGDLLLLGVNEAVARMVGDTGPEEDVLTEYAHASAMQCDTFAWFKVLEVTVDADAAEDESEAYTDDAVVDAGSTKMVQSGVCKARIPALSDWATYCRVPGIASTSTTAVESVSAQRLYELVASTFSKTARKSHASATVLIHGARGCGKTTLASNIGARLGMHLLEVNCYHLVGETDVKTEAYLRFRFEKAGACSPCILLLRNIDALAKKKDDMESGQESAMRFVLADCLKRVAVDAGEFPVAVVATTSEKDKVPDGILGCFRHEVEMNAPDEAERFKILSTLTQQVPLAPDVSVQSLAVRSAALVAADLVNVLKRARNFAQDRMEALAAELATPSAQRDLYLAGEWLTADDFDKAIGEARRNYSDAIGAPKIPNVTWNDVGGLASVKDDILDTIQLPLERPELFASGMKKRSGILFYGPPGTGKTLLAKAVATSFSLNFFSVKGPELLNMYIGESEANVRRVFQRARDARPCVVFFDELDSVAPKRGNQGDSGGVMDRIVSQLLSELDGMGGSEGGGVFVIGATNRPDLLDPALLRPGRFDKMLYLGVPDSDSAQLNILQALTRKFKLDPALDLEEIAKACPFTYTGADFYALCSDAMLKAMTRQASAVDAKVKAQPEPISMQYFFDHLATKADVEVVVSKVDFEEALKELVPSVSQSELDHYKKVQAQFSTPAKEEAKPAAATPTVAVDRKGKGKEVANGHMTNGQRAHFGGDGAEEDEDMYA
ncbi:P-loop containing nucleoside triphosphate hydrolase protein [Protomyces lactucae-debilis]|uniref:Peroxisomal ATPase PEX6 n=1 Tax=Protomyces lactucae-debilis TaxID=2754530 RepID=A0A1Y2FFD5_PROLT|nr:P-loop containing nucleoside triphosphate hydrolase protein [Protomyces lactucae-debilis]ORY82658.1 P-loop containing nucleoside triphosphate hydrolase protein [Protomyces lactucae-debilis]